MMMDATLPVIVEPLWLIELVPMTAMKAGTPAGGDELLPGLLDHVWPQLAAPVGLLANPLKLAGGAPR